MKSLSKFYRIYKDKFDPIYFASLSRSNKRKYVKKMGSNAKAVYLGNIHQRYKPIGYDSLGYCVIGRIKPEVSFNSILNWDIVQHKKGRPLRIEKYEWISLKKVLYTLNSCFTLNKNVKKNAYNTHKEECECHWFEWYHCHKCYGTGEYEHTDVDYDLRNEEYKNKTKAIQRCINAIRVNKHPIKYWTKNWIVYFEYLGKQVSFHDPDGKIECKPFRWERSGLRNKKIPFV